MSERETLEQEVARHAERVAEITAALQGMDDSAREANLLKLELRGRSAAVELGSARLRMLRD